MKINNVLFLQVSIANLYMRRHGLTPSQFVELDKKYNILRFLETGYEPFHLTGNEGVLGEVEAFIDVQQTKSP